MIHKVVWQILKCAYWKFSSSTNPEIVMSGGNILYWIHFIWSFDKSNFCPCLKMQHAYYTLALAGKLKMMVKKYWLSVKNMPIWCEKFQKKNLGSIGWQVHWHLAQQFVLCKAICGPKKIHPVSLTFEPLGLQITMIAQNDRDYLKIKNLCMKKIWTGNGSILAQSTVTQVQN